MNMHQFTLVLDNPREITDQVERQLFEAGCDDALLGSRDKVLFLDFDRDAPVLMDAILSAIHDVEGAGLEATVLRVEPDDLVTTSEIARRTGRSRESVRLLIRGARGPGRFPPPATGTTRRQRLWRWSEVAAWFTRSGLTEFRPALEEAGAIAAINGALQMRRYLPTKSRRNALLRELG